MREEPTSFGEKIKDDIQIQLISSQENGESEEAEQTNVTKDETTEREKLSHTCNKKFKKYFKLRWKSSYWEYLPYFIILISLIEIAVFFVSTEEIKEALVYNPNRRFEIWRFLTYMFLHNDVIHVFLNVVIQCLLAAPLEVEQGHFRTAVVYIGGVIGGSLGSSILDPQLCMVGASAGVYAILIAQIPNILLNFYTIKYKTYRTITVCVLAIADITFTCYHFYTVGNKQPRIGWVAHSSGAFSGLLLGLLLFKGTYEWTKTINMLSGFILLILSSLAITYNISHVPLPLNTST